MNEVFLEGNLGKDPEFKVVGQNKTPFASFSMATSELISKDNWKSTWHNIKCWGSQAEFVRDNIRKGDTVFIKGSIDVEQWEKDGQKHSRVLVKAQIVRLTKKSTRQSQPQDTDTGYEPYNQGGSDW